MRTEATVAHIGVVVVDGGVVCAEKFIIRYSELLRRVVCMQKISSSEAIVVWCGRFRKVAVRQKC